MNGQAIATNQHCLYCQAPTENGKLYCEENYEAHRKAYKRLKPEEREYPRPIQPGIRENRCNVHGEVFTEVWVKSVDSWVSVDGCAKCKQDAAMSSIVSRAMSDPGRISEYSARVEAEMQNRADDITKLVDEELSRLRPSIETDMRNVVRGYVACEIRAEMEDEIRAQIAKGAMPYPAEDLHQGMCPTCRSGEYAKPCEREGYTHYCAFCTAWFNVEGGN